MAKRGRPSKKVMKRRKELKKQRVDAEVTGRAKHFYSIYRKMFTQNKTLDQIYDLYINSSITSDITLL